MKKEIIKELISTGLYLLGVLIVSLLLIKYVTQRTEVEGTSMDPTLKDGESIMIDKISYRFHDPERYDVIVLKPFADDPKTFYIKRVIALPGETIQILKDGSILINGEKIYEAYGKEMILPDRIGREAEPITMGEDEYFVMGDNRNNSGDSRRVEIGNIKREDIVGRAWLRIWPLNRFGTVNKKK
ncbi:MAG: signal peptidase I [Lachnospiraceae bacterium]|nr:signal peptidase I [Lachnospiraceae bacterium]